MGDKPAANLMEVVLKAFSKLPQPAVVRLLT